jgi:hypothetical protein
LNVSVTRFVRVSIAMPRCSGVGENERRDGRDHQMKYARTIPPEISRPNPQKE